MVKQPNLKMIGLFVSIGLLSLFLMLAYFLKSKFSDNESIVVMYFDESVKGLDVGAPVLFKGVKIGEVTEVRLQANLHTMQFLIPVYAKIYNGKSLITNSHDERAKLDKFIQDGLRARLAINSVITGQLLIELDMFPKSKIILHEEAKNQFEIPTIGSPFAEISKSIQVMPITQIADDVHDITQTLDRELPPLLTKMNSTLDTVDYILKENKNQFEIPTIGSPFAEISKSIQVMPITQIADDVHNITQTLDKELPPLLTKMNSTLDTVDYILKENKNNTTKMVAEFGTAAQNVGGAAKSIDLLMEENAVQISTMIETLTAAANSLKNLTDYLQMYPSSIITGKDE